MRRIDRLFPSGFDEAYILGYEDGHADGLMAEGAKLRAAARKDVEAYREYMQNRLDTRDAFINMMLSTLPGEYIERVTKSKSRPS